MTTTSKLLFVIILLLTESFIPGNNSTHNIQSSGTVKKIALLPFWARVTTDSSITTTTVDNYKKNDSSLALQLQEDFHERLLLYNPNNEIIIQSPSETNFILKQINFLYAASLTQKERDIKKLCSLLQVDAVVCCVFINQGVHGRTKIAFNLGHPAMSQKITDQLVSFNYTIYGSNGKLLKEYKREKGATNSDKRTRLGHKYMQKAAKTFPFNKLSLTPIN